MVGRFDVGDSIYDASGPTKLEAYRDFTIAPDGIIPDMERQTACVRFLNGQVVFKGEVYGDSAEEDMRRVQIRETIRLHLEKEEALFARGIKCLSLFFIDEVARYRAYGDDGEELVVGYGKVFEEEYARCVEEYLAQLPLNEPYRTYLASIAAHDTHKGYFSIDKKTNRQVDSTVKRGSDESDDESAYDLILRNKERLLSFDEPTRFIFSHSALREGWDNPNIFQICTLKHSDNETGKRQEVGRGLRLCVDATGERQDLATLGEEEVHSVNVLTVVASESYNDFTASLQSNIRSGLHARPTAVTDAFLKGKAVTTPDGTEVTFSEKESRIAYAWLLQNNYVDYEGTPTERFREEGFNLVAVERLPEDMRAKAPAIEALVKSVYDPHALDGMVSNGLETKVPANKLNDNFERAAFQELWGRIHGKYAYTVEFDSVELIKHAVVRINKDLVVSELAYAMTVGTQHADLRRDDLDSGQFRVRRTAQETVDTGAVAGVTYNLLGEVAAQASITRRTVAAILSRIDAGKYALYQKNPEEFIAKVAKLIVSEKATMIVDHVEYHAIDDEYDTTIFTERMPRNASSAMSVSRGIQDYVFPDSDGEAVFAQALDTADEVEVYAKLPRTFAIPTPVGNYAPDWAIAFKQGMVRHVYFVAETKGTLDTLELRGVEDAKIACAKKLFNEANTSEVRYHEVTNFSDLLALVNGGMD